MRVKVSGKTAWRYKMKNGSIFLPIMLFFLGAVLFTTMRFSSASDKKSKSATTPNLRQAIFAGGCFWCMEPPFEKFPGILKVVSGYTGGKKENPSYKEVASGSTNHAEAIEIHYDPSKISYKDLLEIFWRNIDPTDENGQFVDRGKQYRPAIFYHDNDQKKTAEKSRDALEKSGRFQNKIKTKIVKATTFFQAEEYHQDFYKKNIIRYKIYRAGSGRDQFLKKFWGTDREYTLSRALVKTGENTIKTSFSNTFKKPPLSELKKN